MALMSLWIVQHGSHESVDEVLKSFLITLFIMLYKESGDKKPTEEPFS